MTKTKFKAKRFKKTVLKKTMSILKTILKKTLKRIKMLLKIISVKINNYKKVLIKKIVEILTITAEKIKGKVKRAGKILGDKIRQEVEAMMSVLSNTKIAIARLLISKTISTFVFIPVLASPVMIDNIQADSTNKTCIELKNCDMDKIEDKKLVEIAKIKKYMSDRKMPLSEHAEDFVNISYKYGLDYNLLAAISVRESSGGKNVEFCDYNPFGWASCRIGFKSYNEAIEVVAKNLSGSNKRTAHYYAAKDNEKKLYYYNGTVIEGYEKEVLDIMKKIDSIKIY